MKATAVRKTPSASGRKQKAFGRKPVKGIDSAKAAGKATKGESPLTKAEQQALRRSELTIRSSLASFVEVGSALRAISSGRLYRKKSATFERYCKQFWDMGAKHAYRLMKAADCFDALKRKWSKPAQLPRNESQVRPLTVGLAPSKWVKGWESILSAAGGKDPTAAIAAKVVRGLGEKSAHPNPTKRSAQRPRVPNSAVATIASKVEAALQKKKPTATELRKVLKQVQKDLKRMTNGPAS